MFYRQTAVRCAGTSISSRHACKLGLEAEGLVLPLRPLAGLAKNSPPVFPHRPPPARGPAASGSGGQRPPSLCRRQTAHGSLRLKPVRRPLVPFWVTLARYPHALPLAQPDIAAISWKTASNKAPTPPSRSRRKWLRSRRWRRYRPPTPSRGSPNNFSSCTPSRAPARVPISRARMSCAVSCSRPGATVRCTKSAAAMSLRWSMTSPAGTGHRWRIRRSPYSASSSAG